jgi:hypothetical protein
MSRKPKNPQLLAASITRREVLKALGLVSGAGLAATAFPGTCFSLSGAAEPVQSTAADFYVSTEGDDNWSGRLAVPGQGSSNGPFATLARARDAVRELKRERPEKDVVILVREGFYELDETVVFGLEDGGQGDATVTYAAWPGETPVFSSAPEVSGWARAPADLPDLPQQALGKVWVADVTGRFFTLYDEQGKLPRARSEGFIPLEGGKKDLLRFPKGRLKSWSNIEDVEIVVRPHHAWIVNILPLKSVDEKAQTAHTAVSATYAMNELHFLKGTESCWVENVLEALSSPGEWVLNTQEGKLYLWPRDGTAPRGIRAPRLRELIRVEGAIDDKGSRDMPLRNLRFRGLTFMHGDRYCQVENDAGLQHDWDMLDKDNALLRLRGAENCIVEQCRFAHGGSGAIRVDLHGQGNTISGNTIEHMGGGGILLCGYGPGTKDVNKRNLVYNNHVHHVGEIYWHSPGIMVWQSGENRVANNLIHNTPYTALIISGCMAHFFDRPDGRELTRTIRWHEVGGGPGKKAVGRARQFLHTRDNVFEYNEIHHAMEKLGDGNGIYVRGAGLGNVMRRNFVHHLVAPIRMQAGIRTDGGQRDTLISENLVYKCTAQGIILKLNNRCENNIVADVIAPPRGYYLSLREGPMSGATIKRNVFYSSRAECRFIDELPPGDDRKTEDRRGRKLARAKDAETDHNIYFCAADHGVGQTMLEKQRADGVDLNSLAVDPLFVDPANGDFRFREGSPAPSLGIVPIDVSRIGLRS